MPDGSDIFQRRIVGLTLKRRIINVISASDDTSCVEADETCCESGSGGDPGNSCETAAPLLTGVPQTHTLDDECHWFSWDAPTPGSGELARFRLTDVTGSVTVRLFTGPCNDLVSGDTEYSGAVCVNHEFGAETLYWARVCGTGTYTIEYDIGDCSESGTSGESGESGGSGEYDCWCDQYSFYDPFGDPQTLDRLSETVWANVDWTMSVTPDSGCSGYWQLTDTGTYQLEADGWDGVDSVEFTYIPGNPEVSFDVYCGSNPGSAPESGGGGGNVEGGTTCANAPLISLGQEISGSHSDGMSRYWKIGPLSGPVKINVTGNVSGADGLYIGAIDAVCSNEFGAYLGQVYSEGCTNIGSFPISGYSYLHVRFVGYSGIPFSFVVESGTC